jgi:alpha-tubulin suppressor-like RCC1 family protein
LIFTAAAVSASTLRAQEQPPQVRVGTYTCGVLRGVALCNTRLLHSAVEDSGLAPIPGDPGLITLETSYQAVCGLTRAGELYCIGAGPHPKYGPYTTNTVLTNPCGDACNLELVRVASPLTFRTIGFSGFSLCGITLAGPTYCWGRNQERQLGNPALRRNQTVTPQRVVTSATFTSVVTSDTFACALTPQGRAWCWGESIDTTLVIHPQPVPIAPDLAFTSLTAGMSHACGLTADGAAWCWGLLPGGISTSRPVPVLPAFRFRAIAAGWTGTCGITMQGPTLCWGQGASEPLTVPGGHAFVGITMNHSDVVITVTADAAVYAWGAGGGGASFLLSEPNLVPFVPYAFRRTAPPVLPSPGSKAPGSRSPKTLVPRRP